KVHMDVTSYERSSKDSDEILNHVKINCTSETPYSTIKGLLKKLWLLKNYSFQNLSALSKIMKKYDKVTPRNASKSYLNMVDSLYIGNSDEVTRVIERVEVTFIKHFSNSNRSKGMNTLRPKAKKERHGTTFSLGFFTGCTISLLVALFLIIHLRKLLKTEGFGRYMDNLFPLYRRYHVNYSFIFGFKQGTELGYREVLLLSTGLATLAFASVLANLDMEMDEKTKDFRAFTELLPLGLVILLLVIIFFPFNIIFRSSRFFLLCCVFRCICAPLYKVTLPDFFLADQLTSQIQALRSLEFYLCYYGWGDFKQRRNMCKSNYVYNMFYFIVATIPYWWRLLQCLRRLVEERDPMQGYNGLKYFSTIVAVLMRTAYSRQRGQVLNVVLRLAWLQTVLNFQVSFLHREALIAIVAGLEVIRRGIWNFFRLENEHLNNVGKYRAFKSVPLPFNYDENEDRRIVL
ncbi:hypothetical protein IFM89_014211, partial [Coptis chinensis]